MGGVYCKYSLFLQDRNTTSHKGLLIPIEYACVEMYMISCMISCFGLPYTFSLVRSVRIPECSILQIVFCFEKRALISKVSDDVYVL